MTEPSEPTLDWETFQAVDIRVGTVLAVGPNPKARIPAWVLDIDLGPLGVRRSSAQITDLYTEADLIGRQVLCVVNFPPKRVAGVKSEVLVTGVPDEQGQIVLAGVESPVPNGSRLF